MSRSFACLAAVGALATAAPAAAEITWIMAPTNAEMAAAYPGKARAAGLGGGVELACTSTRTGDMTDCDVLGESPRGYGFGQAARKLVKAMRGADLRKDVEVRISMTFAPELARGQPVTVKTPRWTALPSVEDMQAAAPKGDAGGPNDVRVTLLCDVQAGGVLSGCVVDREIPAGQGFGPAILALAPKFRVGLMSAEGMPTVGAKVRVPVRFDLKPAQAAAK
ncbi:TonB family protein [Phenylobacterium sp.]|uniref:TonB family protein n=1 Tax=Phenylobacterium sp. TaxID=1871053 RepID=UPI0025D2F9EE|nr:TonB family protein [Phenylobacterium sp.]MBX3482446.1 TonB family protein [Phenylobacterium sp.]MCW5761393.1 TonB family protein [Phenylobacterium sp.]